jgi:hypothetical protein
MPDPVMFILIALSFIAIEACTMLFGGHSSGGVFIEKHTWQEAVSHSNN